ncbi:MAG: RNA polymerase sigma factor [Candidatus Peribacteria bacterium]|jgi:RNA polymerase sigma-70 factor (ECF subfamily)|nr:RNA polymerase sigma factor [Candidatus Peribacteria bacterium]
MEIDTVERKIETFSIRLYLSYQGMIKDDCMLVQQVQQGKYSSFEALYHKYFQRIYSFVMIKSGGNVPLSQDITSETFLKAFERIAQFSCTETGSFVARLYKIAYTTFIDMIKVKKADLSLDERYEASATVDMVDLYEKKQQTQEIIRFLDQLGSEKKDIFLLRIWDEMDYKEIADIIGKSVENCRQEFSRTMKKVEERFKK